MKRIAIFIVVVAVGIFVTVAVAQTPAVQIKPSTSLDSLIQLLAAVTGGGGLVLVANWLRGRRSAPTDNVTKMMAAAASGGEAAMKVSRDAMDQVVDLRKQLTASMQQVTELSKQLTVAMEERDDLRTKVDRLRRQFAMFGAQLMGILDIWERYGKDGAVADQTRIAEAVKQCRELLVSTSNGSAV